MRTRYFTAFLVIASLLAGCTANGNWAHNDTKSSLGRTRDDLVTVPAEILVTSNDITDRAYQRLGYLRVRVVRGSPLHVRLTRQEADQKLQDEAAQLGADAVVNVKYGNRTLDVLEIGSLDATGTAIKFFD